MRGVLTAAAPAFAFGAVLLLIPSASGQGREHEYLSPAAGTATQRFGNSLAVDGDVMVAGAPHEDSFGVNTGAAFVFRWDAAAGSWIEEQQLFPSDPESNSGFGRNVAISDDVIVVGAPSEDNANGADAGAAYVYRFDAVLGLFVEEKKLIEVGGWTGNQFGASVGVDGTGLVIGASMCDMAWGVDAGCAYVYRYVGAPSYWVDEVMLSDPFGGWRDRAGHAVAIQGDLVLVAAPQSTEAGVNDAGGVAVWRKNGAAWSYDQRLTSSHKSPQDQFGLAVALRDDLVLVGAPLEDLDSKTADTGAAYLFRHDGSAFVEEVRLTHPAPAAGNRFGSGIGVSGRLAVIGAMYDDVLGSDAGCAFTFREKRGAWHLDQRLGASDAAAGDRFGGQVAMHDSQFLIGADGNDTPAGVDWGVVYGYLAAEINLEVDPAAPAPDQPVTFTAFHGTPGDVVITAVVEINGAPYFVPIFTDLFGSDHAWTITVNAPNPAYGLHLGLRAFKISATGPVVFSEIAPLDV